LVVCVAFAPLAFVILVFGLGAGVDFVSSRTVIRGFRSMSGSGVAWFSNRTAGLRFRSTDVDATVGSILGAAGVAGAGGVGGVSSVGSTRRALIAPRDAAAILTFGVTACSSEKAIT
jgi:hypothetical protein